jgi:hypothetical protein
MIAATLLDNPWVVLVLVVGGAIVNWLSSRARQTSEDDPDTDPDRSPPGQRLDREEMLRRFLGQETPAVPPPAPPPAPPRARFPAPPGGIPSLPFVPPLMEARAVVPPPARTGRPPRSEKARPAKAVPQPMPRPVTPGPFTGVPSLRRPAAARQAWKLSVILGPPKGMEP